MKQRLRISVRGLVEHALRCGDLNLERFGASSPVDAIRAHQKVQSSRGEGYRPELTVNHVVENDHFILEVGGRIDGVLEADGRVVIEEIKTTAGDVDAIAARDEPTHWGQLRVYAHLYALENDVAELRGRLTYYHIDTGATREVERPLEVDDLRVLFDELVARYLDWAKRIADWRSSRDLSIGSTGFPFSAYRSGQRQMAVQVYRAIQERGRLLVRAPTGIGKTQATLFPAIKALGGGDVDKIFYLTARTTGHGVAEKAVRELRNGGLRVKSLTLTAKDKICFNPDKACNGDECEFARGFYDRIRPAVEEVLARDDFSREGIESVARTHRVCPFELALELALWVDVIIGDYNYVFDPRTYLRRFFDDDTGAYVFLIDEAHNLVDRARHMYSAELRKRDVMALRRALDKTRHRSLHRSTNAVNRALRDARAHVESASTRREPPEELYPALERFRREAEGFLASRAERDRAVHHAVLELYFGVARFLRVAERFDPRYVTCYEAIGRHDLRVKLFCTDPSRELSETLGKARSSVFFSATLTPMEYFRTTLGCGDDAASYALPSPFPAEHLEVLVNDRVATTYRRRDRTRGELVEILSAFVSPKRGNYLLYFPSYAYLRSVLEEFPGDGVVTLVQRPDMDEAARAEFLERFAADNSETRVGFAVMGGFFGEGIDLVGERLAGAAIVGVGLPGLSPERDEIRRHFEEKRGTGFDYAYAFPGMNRVLQAAGRVIRSETDRGVVLLVDERFATPQYRRLLPPEWHPVTVGDAAALSDRLQRFWSRERTTPPV